MPRSSLLRDLQRFALHAEIDRPTPLGRRGFLAGAGAALLVPALPALAAAEARVAIVGAGLAGLAAARSLRRAGLSPVIFEAATRMGGRCVTNRDSFGPDQIAERGAEFIDSGHTAMRRLAGELGLVLDDVRADEPAGTRAIYWLDGRPYTQAQATRDFAAIWPILRAQQRAVGPVVTYRHATKAARTLDRISAGAWIGRHVPGGRASGLGRLLASAIAEENAADADAQSALSLVGVFAVTPRDDFTLYDAASDQRFHVRGGNDQIVRRLAEDFANRIEPASALIAIEANPGRHCRLVFARDGATVERVFDRVILALPFAVMRGSVDLARSGFRPLKRRAIATLAMGRSVKLHGQFDRRVWHASGCSGEVRIDDGPFQTSWDATRAQHGDGGLLAFWSGGSVAGRAGGLAGGPGSAAEALAASMRAAEPALAGLAQHWTGKVAREVWETNPFSRGSYSYAAPGYLTEVYGIEREPEGACHFAGEHTADDQAFGYMESAVVTGQRAAREVIQALARRG